MEFSGIETFLYIVSYLQLLAVILRFPFLYSKYSKNFRDSTNWNRETEYPFGDGNKTTKWGWKKWSESHIFDINFIIIIFRPNITLVFQKTENVLMKNPDFYGLNVTQLLQRVKNFNFISFSLGYVISYTIETSHFGYLCWNHAK